MDDKPASSAPMELNSHKLYSFATGGSMSDVISRLDYTPSTLDYIKHLKWTQRDRIAS